MISKNEIIELIEKAEEGPTLDYKEDLPLAADGDKARFVKDVIALANSGKTSHIIVGVEDGTGRPVGLKTSHKVEQLNQILKDKCDPPISVEYTERNILGYPIGVIEITGENRPYVVAVPDRYGGALSSDPNKPFYIERGTVFVRNFNMNEGAKRADLDKMYQVKYVTLQADLRLNHEVSVKPLDDMLEVDIKFVLVNTGDVLATDAYVWMQFTNIKQLVKCMGNWLDISKFNKNIPTIRILADTPVCPSINFHCEGVTLRVDKELDRIEAQVTLGASGTRIKEGRYVIQLQKPKLIKGSKLETI